jgi:hypothetical protein
MAGAVKIVGWYGVLKSILEANGRRTVKVGDAGISGL